MKDLGIAWIFPILESEKVFEKGETFRKTCGIPDPEIPSLKTAWEGCVQKPFLSLRSKANFGLSLRSNPDFQPRENDLKNKSHTL
jgi:hypothetical protein